MAEDKLSIVDNGTVEISIEPIAVTRNLAPKYLKLFTKFSIELNNLVLEDVISNSGEFVGKVDSVHRPDNKSIPLLVACNVGNVSGITQLDVRLNEKSVVCQSLVDKYSSIDEIKTLWEEKE